MNEAKEGLAIQKIKDIFPGISIRKAQEILLKIDDVIALHLTDPSWYYRYLGEKLRKCKEDLCQVD